MIQINDQDSLSLSELSLGLNAAAERGLQLVILNSCKGLGIARSIAEVRIPYTVLMREEVSDQVAHAFLQYFLESFSQGEPLHRSLRIARDRLDEGLRDKFPTASWLPVVCQHPSASVLRWPRFGPRNRALQAALAVGLLGLVGVGIGRMIDSKMSQTGVDPIAFSQGCQSLVPQLEQQGKEVLRHKKDGMADFCRGDYQTAIAQFEAALQRHPNDPETRIYKNNAQNRLDKAETVTIAVPLPMSQDLDASLEILRGVAQAQEELNQAGGIGGKRLQLLLVDDDNDKTSAAKIAQRLSQNAEVIGVICCNTSDLSLASVEAYTTGKLSVIAPVATAVDLSNSSDYFFRTVPNDNMAAKSLAEYAYYKLGSSRAVVYFNEQSDYSKSLKQAFSTEFSRLGGEVVMDVDFVSGKTGFNPQDDLKAAKDKGADAIVLFPSGNVLDKAFLVMDSNVKQGQLPMLAGDDVYNSRTLDLGGDKAIGSVLSVPWHRDNSPDPDFPEKANALWEAQVSWRTAMSYDAVLAIAQALKTDPSRSGVYNALADPNFKARGASGTIQFDDSGDRKDAPTQLVQIMRDPKTGKVYFKPIQN
ncbi:MAG: ABC transporter substrate-binding protein [Synechococcales cyanobacterium RU_4_20]|nr:ABC transporter substrate-binding protein [Synechococcales cyanobacterium RU_4_20]